MSERFPGVFSCFVLRLWQIAAPIHGEARKMLGSLDSFDLKVLGILQGEGRISMTDLAEQVGLSASPCARRVKRLEDEGYIERYVALLNANKLGVGLLAFVNIRLRSQTRDAFDKFDAAIAEIPEIVGCHLLTGTYDYLLQVRVENIEEFRKFMRAQLTAIEGVVETQSSIVLEHIKSTTAVRLPMI